MSGLYRKRPIVVEAVQFAGMFPLAFLRDDQDSVRSAGDGAILIDTLEGTMRVEPGDWIIRGIQGELYPCKNEIFLATYEPVAEDEGVQGLREAEGA